MKMILLSRQL